MPMTDEEIEALPEPARTQERLGHGKWGHPRRLSVGEGETLEQRQGWVDDLKRLDDPDAKQFRRENPDADIYDFQRWVEHGRLRGGPDVGTTARDMARSWPKAGVPRVLVRDLGRGGGR